MCNGIKRTNQNDKSSLGKLYFTMLSFQIGQSLNMEWEGFMTDTAPYHQVAIEIFWLLVLEALLSSISF